MSLLCAPKADIGQAGGVTTDTPSASATCLYRAERSVAAFGLSDIVPQRFAGGVGEAMGACAPVQAAVPAPDVQSKKFADRAVRVGLRILVSFGRYHVGRRTAEQDGCEFIPVQASDPRLFDRSPVEGMSGSIAVAGIRLEHGAGPSGAWFRVAPGD